MVWVILGIESLSDKPAFIRARMIGQPDAQALLLPLVLPLLMQRDCLPVVQPRRRRRRRELTGARSAERARERESDENHVSPCVSWFCVVSAPCVGTMGPVSPGDYAKGTQPPRTCTSRIGKNRSRGSRVAESSPRICPVSPYTEKRNIGLRSE